MNIHQSKKGITIQISFADLKEAERLRRQGDGSDDIRVRVKTNMKGMKEGYILTVLYAGTYTPISKGFESQSAFSVPWQRTCVWKED